MKSLILQRACGGSIEIGTKALQRLEKYREAEEEGGGVLLGRYIRGTQDIVVDEITEPQPSDKRSLFAFLRDALAHQRIIDWFWKQSSGTTNYLGEWHSHPEDNPTPSAQDLKDWRRKLREDTVDAESTHFIIVGKKEIVVYEGCKKTFRLHELDARPATQ